MVADLADDRIDEGGQKARRRRDSHIAIQTEARQVGHVFQCGEGYR